MDISEKIYEFVCSKPGKKARQIAIDLDIDKTKVNSILYSTLRSKVNQDKEYRWWPVLDAKKTNLKPKEESEFKNDALSKNTNPESAPGVVEFKASEELLTNATKEKEVDEEIKKNPEIKTLPKMINKITSLIDYLSELTRINSKITRDLNEYRKVLWISDIPNEPKYCFARVWGVEDEHGDSWVEVKKFSEPQVPKVPDICKPWINLKSLRKPDEIPELEKSITVEIEKKDSSTGEIEKIPKTLHLLDFPEIQKVWKVYLENEWKPWTELFKRHLAVQRVYSDLFLIHQELQKLGEQYELVFSFGFLTWKNPLGNLVRRHLITAKASLEFEPHLGLFTIGPSNDGDQAEVELDMLDLEVQPQNSKKLIEDGRVILRENLWDKASIDSLLYTIANSLAEGGQGEYQKDQMGPTNVSPNKKPIVEYAPALILRKRSMRGLERLLAKIKEKIKAGESAPREFLDLCESLGDAQEDIYFEVEENEELGVKDSLQKPLESNEIYFPLLANEEQRQIIKALNRQNGVLVQGPPGTGKSHTIANIICHLLATGKRVLVTAKTGRALQVLSDKLPAEIKPLCISLLGSGIEERKSLEKSVDGILKKLDKRSTGNDLKRIKALEDQLYESRKAKTEIDRKLVALREKETFKHVIGNGKFSGTAAQIARQIEGEEEKNSWFVDRVKLDADCPLSPDEIDSLSQAVNDFDQETEKNLSLYIPDFEKDLPIIKNARYIFRDEEETKKILVEKISFVNEPESRILLNVDKNLVENLIENLEKFSVEGDSVSKRSMVWIPKAVSDVLTNNETQWKELLKLSVQHSINIKETASKVDAFQLKISPDIDLSKLLSDAIVVKKHLEAGGKIGFWIFKPKAIREHGSFLKKVKIDGIECNTEVEVQKLINFLTVKQELEYIWSLWAGKAIRQNAPLPLQVAEIQELQDALGSVLNLYILKEKAKEVIGKIAGLNNPKWESNVSVQKLIDISHAVIFQRKQRLLSESINQIEAELLKITSRKDVHPIVNEVLQAVKKRDGELCAELVSRVFELRQKAHRVQNKNLIISKIQKLAPNFAPRLIHCDDPKIWIERLKRINEVWEWGRAKTWVEDFFNEDLESLERQRSRYVEEIQKNLETLSSVLAWDFCFKRMGDEHRRHLMAWKQAMTKLGKGTGKYAYTHRQNAQRHLNECREAVPAWIMPIHKVYETVEAGAGIFDVIIVDEASQCGPEALPLLYLGKRIIVVGDDKQISPEAVGVNREQTQRLMKDYLSEFQHADSFDIEKSLFDHGSIRFTNRIALREHFRCMPEIIRFSNDLCYQTDPLIPLRQYPPDRLEPIKTKYVPTGFREGEGQRAINRPEAEAVVEQIVKCCQEANYEGMTMGVIALQGDSQAYLIEELLLKQLGAEEMESRKLICGNPYTFQGDERDVIFLSMVAAPNERIGALTKATDQRRFNVAASRAQDQVWLFHSVSLGDLSEHCFRRRLLAYYSDPKSQIDQALGGIADDLRKLSHQANRSIEKAPAPFDSWFEVDVALDIAGRGYRVVPQFQFADKRIDIVVQGLQAQIAVECDGDSWHGQEEYADDMERQRKLERCGWHFVRIRESNYYAAREKALEPLWETLKERDILPIAQEKTTDVLERRNIKESQEDHEEHLEINDDLPEEDLDDGEATQQGSAVELGLRFSGATDGIPSNIDEALQAEPEVIGEAVIEILKNRPNNSCMRDNMPTYILKKWIVRTRSRPRQQFAKKVNSQIAIMIRKGYLVRYKSVNERIKLGWKKYPSN